MHGGTSRSPDALMEISMFKHAYYFFIYMGIHGSIAMYDDHHLVEAVWNTVHASYPIEHIL